ncbi:MULTISPECIES: GNAT family N-acetyltransferase [unclassified Oleiphilus]|uniref:GNAT family N-acetyltransferase n=2 Tax=Oleiphilus TaxID=141450 RepID=UPI0007C376E4|nr:MULTISPECIES: GNAT family N-acetyltransferase [unclassified Oleiphilus]KZY62704.1 phosphinothricin acetyltransferase [Oleiphilus sp. HI0066]KZY70849.1 phosphinothricin acetyltransferase [Oleiphilus sp. HI0067]
MSNSSYLIRDVQAFDAERIADIYNYYIKHTVVTFEEEPLDANQILTRINQVQELGLPWLVAEQDGQGLGYAYSAPWRERSAYRYSKEVSVYLDANLHHKGVGSMLYQALFERLSQLDVHAVMAVVALPNEASEALHEKFGMKKVAHLEQVGRKFGQWIDVGYWQRVF